MLNLYHSNNDRPVFDVYFEINPSLAYQLSLRRYLIAVFFSFFFLCSNVHFYRIEQKKMKINANNYNDIIETVRQQTFDLMTKKKSCLSISDDDDA